MYATASSFAGGPASEFVLSDIRLVAGLRTKSASTSFPSPPIPRTRTVSAVPAAPSAARLHWQTL